MARPTKYDETKAEQIADRLRDGCTRKDAAGSVGVSEDTFARWLARYADFAGLVEVAEAACAVRMTTIVTTAAVTDWKAAMEWLKRRRRDDWGDRSAVDTEVSGAGGGPIRITEVVVERPAPRVEAE